MSNTTEPTLSPSYQSDSSQNLTSPAVTQMNIITTSPGSYNVTMIKFGLQIEMNDTIFKEYNISVNDGNNFKNQSCDQSSTCNITGLKPCTDYTVIVNALWNDAEISCQNSENKVTTESAAPDDIKVSKHRPGHVCYQSDWDISNSQSTPDRNKIEISDGSVCFKLKEEDFCSSFTVDFNSESCETVKITKDITIDFIDPPEIDQPKPTKHPVRIEPKLPPNCKNLMVEYTCSETRPPGKQMNLSVLEPYTDYSCTGEIKNETFVFIRTPPVIFNIDCGFHIDGRSTSDNTSIQLDWTSTNRSCGVDLPKLSYICSCDTKKDIKSRVEPCVFTGLEPYTDYTCEVHPTYNNEKVNQGWKKTVKTKAGVPTKVQNLRLTVPENNVIDVKCDEPKKLHGPKGRYKARLHDPNGPVKEEKNFYCDFTFKDLSYSTTYRVEVTVYNGFHESPDVIENINTSCMCLC
ncbi:receptor-type tyrosine-protein phosphatase C-like [Oryzias melastigma]|uniref:receptor-type tyrosine-protein phosphatase C-like n=1 Tax=Oryzias melastigma TaxID=30732 RepID=UPI00168D6612|nr:receptor-type tyrosine-protein phosphatase C-like [Oryzias melastigma]